MSTMPGSTVQCVNPHCEVRGHWQRAEAVESTLCPMCGQPVRPVLPPLMPPRLRFRPRHVAPRPPMRPR